MGHYRRNGKSGIYPFDVFLCNIFKNEKKNMDKVGFLLVGLMGIALVSCGGNGQSQQTVNPVKVKTMEVSARTWDGSKEFSGTVEEATGTPLSFSVMGTVKQVHFRLGERVRAGQLLVSLDGVSMRSSHDAARATLMQAEDAYRRMKELYDKGSLPEIKWIEVQSKLSQARAVEEVARKNLEDCRLYAPFDGVIADKSVEVGQNVMPGVPVGKLVGTSRMKIKIAVPETEIAEVALRQKATVTVPALAGKRITGTVGEKGVVAHPLSRSYEVKIELEQAAPALLPGMVVKVMLEGIKDAGLVIIPARIVQLDERNRSFVWLDKDGKAVRRIITCGEYTAKGVTVLSGLEMGDKVIIEGQQKVCEGTEVCL